MTPAERSARHSHLMLDRWHRDLTEEYSPDGWRHFKRAVRNAALWAIILVLLRTFHKTTGRRSSYPTIADEDEEYPTLEPIEETPPAQAARDASGGTMVLQRTAKKRRIITPESFLEHNPDIDELIDPDAVKERVDEALKIEKVFFKEKAPKIKSEDVKPVSAKRLAMIKRNLINDLRQDAFWSALRVPSVLANTAYVEYRSAHVPRTRPTHAAMSGFLATPHWDGCHTERPLCGWNCLCFCLVVTYAEAKARHLINEDDTTAFDYSFPNTASETNFDKGTFPDPGFHGPKPTI